MKTLITLLAIVFLSLFNTNTSNAQKRTTQLVTINVAEMSALSTSGVLTFNFTTLAAGEDPEPQTATTTYSVATNGANKKISAVLDTDLPTGISMAAQMSATSNGSSSGVQPLSTTSVDLVTGISREKGSLLDIDWETTITVDAVPASHQRVVTMTLTNM